MLLKVSLSLVYDFISKHYSNNQPINQTIQNTSFRDNYLVPPDRMSIVPDSLSDLNQASGHFFLRRRSFSSHTADKKSRLKSDIPVRCEDSSPKRVSPL